MSLIQLFNGDIDKIKFQKLLFIYSQRKQKSEYDFVPYKFGCYSYSANADLKTMVKRELLSETENRLFKMDTTNYLNSIKITDKDILTDISLTYGNMSNDTLIKHSYINFPFYAIKSTIAKKILNKDIYQRIQNSIPTQTSQKLFKIGYEGISIENYLNRLIKNNIKLLVDVRKNPLSQKYGFSKTTLKRCCENLDIQYIHIPEVGIMSNQRQSLETQSDYDKLFEKYRMTTLRETTSNQSEILKLLDKFNRIALTCFEANIHQCHRFHLSEALKTQKIDLLVEHI